MSLSGRCLSGSGSLVAAAAFSSAAPRFSGSLTVSDIEKLTSDIKAKFNSAVDRIESRGSGGDGGGWDDTFGALSLALGEASESSAAVTLPSMTHSDAAARSASASAKDELKKMFDGAFARPGLYGALSSADRSTGGGDSRLASAFLRRFRRNGCGLEDETSRAALAEKRGAIERTCSAFCGAINENRETLTFSDEELDGVPDLSQFPLVGGGDDDGSVGGGGGGLGGGRPRRKVTLKAPDTTPVLQFAKNPETRRAVAVAMAKKCQEENTDRFLDALRLRHECAQLLGYPSHAHYMLETTMASSPERVEAFLVDLIDRFAGQKEKDLEVLRALKEEEEGPDAGPLRTWDMQYYIRAHKATLGVDEAELQKYFPLDHVKGEILSIYEELLGLKFTRLADAEVWHPDVECYAVHSASADAEEGDGEPLGHFYLDLFPRDGKYSHQCVYPLRPSYVPDGASGERVRPACANIGNLSRPTDGKPSMLRFREVETFFHEFGHVMHCVLGRSEHSLHAWAWSAVPWPGGVEQDFLEVPSMMLENFVWQPQILRRLSSRPADGASLPEEMIDALSKSRFVMKGYQDSRYLAMALYDLIVHSSPGPYGYKGQEYDALALFDAMMFDISGLSTIPDTFAVASWYHPMMGYDAGYYSYIWSEAYAADLFSSFEASSCDVDPALGRKYREAILSPCAMQDGNVMLRNFLGRNPSSDAFFRRLNLA